MSVKGLEEAEKIAKQIDRQYKSRLLQQKREIAEEIEKIRFLLDGDKDALRTWRMQPASSDRLSKIMSQLDEVEQLYLEAGNSQAAQLFRQRVEKQLSQKLTNLKSYEQELRIRAKKLELQTKSQTLSKLNKIKREGALREMYQESRSSGGFLSNFGKAYLQDIVTINTKQAGSKTIGEYMTNLYNTYEQALKNVLTRGIVRGDSYKTMINNLTKATNITTRKAELLVRTESNSVFNDAVKNVIQTNPLVKGYRFRAVLDRRTSKICQQHDGDFIPKDRIQPGVNYPPLHPNCRSTVTTVLMSENERKDTTQRYTKNGSNQWVPVPPGTTYAEFKANINTYLQKISPRVNTQVIQVAQPVQGKDITATFARNSQAYPFAVNQVVHQQRYDGKPAIVKKEEFDKIAKASNFIAQRTYSAPTREMLDLYQKSLYEGEWYIDCSTGGAAYGRGMYCSAARSATVTDNIKKDMTYYSTASVKGTPSVVETFTLQPDAKIVREEDIQRMFFGEPSEAQINKYATDFEYNSTKNLSQDERLYLNWRLGRGVNFSQISSLKLSNPEALDKLSDSIAQARYSYIREHTLSQTQIDALHAKYQDIGTYAAALGYDAIDASRKANAEGYYVILNRTKVVFLKEGE